jgi:single-strand DNA-binding protein
MIGRCPATLVAGDLICEPNGGSTMFETHVTVVGSVITAVNRRRLSDGTAVANFRIASNERRFDRASETWTDGDSLYLSVSCWRQLAENVHSTFDIGDPIIVRGRLHTRSYDDKDGKRQTIVELEAVAAGPDLTRSTAKIVRLRRDGTPLQAAPRASEGPGGAAGAIASDDPWTVATDADADERDGDQGNAEYRPAAEAAVGG